MPPKHQRRSHTKSKKGCSQCKVRRIKCNEVHPVCSNCDRRQITCDFSSSTGRALSHSHQDGRQATSSPGSHHNSRSDSNSNLSGSGNGVYDHRRSSSQPKNPFLIPDLHSTKRTTDLDVSDLQLMHHFTTSTAFDLANNQHGDALNLWQIHAPALAFKHDFLLRGILAVSALHQGTQPSKAHRKMEFDLKASTHQSLALASYQETLTHVDASNCHALFLFSCLIIIMAFASNAKDHKPRKIHATTTTVSSSSSDKNAGESNNNNSHGKTTVAINNNNNSSSTSDDAILEEDEDGTNFKTSVLHWFWLLRGCNEVLKLHHDILTASFLKPLLDELNYTENHAAYSVPDADRITDLFAICASSSSNKNSHSPHDREIAQAYTLAIHSLLSTFIQASMLKKRGEGMVLASFVWPVNLPPKFLDLLSEKRPEAMVILAHYCVLIYWGEENNTWFMIGWARYMLDTIKAVIPEEWHRHVEWPDAVIG